LVVKYLIILEVKMKGIDECAGKYIEVSGQYYYWVKQNEL